MRKLSLALVVGLCFLGMSSAAGATSVNLIWSSTNGAVFSQSGNSVTVSGAATLTLEVQFDIDSRGTPGAFLTFNWDTDLKNELNLIEWTELSWSNGSGKRCRNVRSSIRSVLRSD